MALSPAEQRDVIQALAIADEMNNFVIAKAIKVPARIQFIAHLVAALGLAQANGFSYNKVRDMLQKMHNEMDRTIEERDKPKRPRFRVVETPNKEI